MPLKIIYARDKIELTFSEVQRIVADYILHELGREVDDTKVSISETGGRGFMTLELKPAPERAP